jgi:hypothetical protein
MNFVVLALGLIAIPGCLYGLHRLGLYLERRGVIYYWHKRPTGGSGYNPLQEVIQPQIRHANEVCEQRLEDGSDGGPVVPRASRP